MLDLRRLNSVLSRIAKVFTGRRRIDDDLLEDLEEVPMMSDVGVDTTENIIGRLKKRAPGRHMLIWKSL